MKKTLLFFLVLVAVVIHVRGSFIDANAEAVNEKAYESEKMVIEHLFQKRSELWNHIYEEKMTIAEWSEELKKIVGEPLLSFDIKAFQEAYEYPTNMDKVLSVKVIDIDKVKYGEDEMTANVKIQWSMQGISSKYTEEIDYIIILELVDEKWKLLDYTIYS